MELEQVCRIFMIRETVLLVMKPSDMVNLTAGAVGLPSQSMDYQVEMLKYLRKF
jgi:hypothetical protein